MESSDSNFKSRNFNLLLYPNEDPTHASALEYIQSNYRYASICHSRDTFTEADEKTNPEHKAGTLKKPHTHVVVQFTQARWRSALAKELGIPENYIDRCRSLESSLRYLVHADHSDKVQYETSEVAGPLKVVLDKCLMNVTEDERILQICALLDDFVTPVSVSAFVRLVCERGYYSDFRRSASVFLRLIQEHNEALK